MIRLSLRQFRSQASIAVALLIVVAIALGLTGPHFAHIYNVFATAHAACVTSTTCANVQVRVGTLDSLLRLIGTALVATPALVGAFWGAPLISREFENGTHQLVWTQSVTRTRWVAVKLTVVGTACVAATGLLSLMVTWWSSAMDRANMNRFGAGLFGERNIAPLGYAAFAFALGVTAGIIIRRTLPSMALSMGAFLGARLAFTYLVRPHLLPPRHITTTLSAVTQGFGSSNGGPASLFLGAPNLPNAWIYSTRAVDAGGHPLTSQIAGSACPQLAQPPPGPPPGAGQRVVASNLARDALQDCVTKLGATYHGVVTYQPANRYWPFQWLETGSYLIAALALIGLGFYWLRRHPA
jgi:hypothetical protein